MTAREHILNELGILVSKFPKVRARYEYDREASVHFVEVVPNEVYRLDEAYIAWENDMTDGFIDLFPTQNICFISDDALVGIRKAEYIFEGLAFAPLSTHSPKINFAPEIATTMIHTTTTRSAAHVTQSKNDVFVSYRTPSSLTYRLAA